MKVFNCWGRDVVKGWSRVTVFYHSGCFRSDLEVARSLQRVSISRPFFHNMDLPFNTSCYLIPEVLNSWLSEARDC